LADEFLGFTIREVGRKQWRASVYGPGYGGDELHDGLVRQSHRAFLDSAAQNMRGYPLLGGEPTVKSVDQNIGVN
jgi:hypothetical protein